MASVDKSWSVPENDVEGFGQECGLCLKEGKHNQANHFCQHCVTAVCVSCRASHTRFPVLRNHKILPIAMMKKDCGLCLAEGLKKDARQFFRDCDSWICDSCKNSHLKFPDLSSHSIITADKVQMGKSSKPTDVSAHFSHLSTVPSDESTKGLSKATDMSSKPSSDSSNVNSRAAGTSTKPGSVSVTSSMSSTKPAPSASNKFTNKYNCVSGVKIISSRRLNIRLPHDRHKPRIVGCCFMPTGELVLCDRKNQNIKLLDKSLTLVDNVQTACPQDVAVVDDKTVVVTSPDKKRLRFVEVLPKLKNSRMISVDKECWGIAVAAGQIFVSFYTFDYERDDGISSDDGEIRVYDLQGTLKKRIV